jgi:myo-inositol-1(or 4)-monophosphatase
MSAEDRIDARFLLSLLKEAGKMALAERGHNLSTLVKQDDTPVTMVDHKIEAYLVERISHRYQEHSIICEEGSRHVGECDITWAIDPIDGTRSYASGLPIWGVSIGVLFQKRPLIGGYYMPATGDLFWGTTESAYHNELPLPILIPGNVNEHLTFLAIPSNFHLYFETDYPRLRALGSVAAHLAYVATGAAVAALTRKVSLWDIAGLLPLLSAVHAQVMYYSGTPFSVSDLMDGYPAKEPILIVQPGAWEQIRAVIQLKC